MAAPHPRPKVCATSASRGCGRLRAVTRLSSPCPRIARTAAADRHSPRGRAELPPPARSIPELAPRRPISSSVDAIQTRSRPARRGLLAQPARPDDRVDRHARLARAADELADDLAAEALLVDAALAGDDELRRAHALVDAAARRAPPPRPGEARRRTPPTARPTGRPRRRVAAHAARVARQLDGEPSQARAPAARPSPRRRPSAARTRAARPRRRSRRRTAPRAARRRARRPRGSPRSRRGRRRSSRCRRPRRGSRARPRATAARISSPVPRVDAAQASRSCSATSASPDACAISTIAVSPDEREAAVDRPAERIAGARGDERAAERLRRAAPSCPRRRRRPGSGRPPSRPARAARERVGDGRRGVRALEGVGRDEHARHRTPEAAIAQRRERSRSGQRRSPTSAKLHGEHGRRRPDVRPAVALDVLRRRARARRRRRRRGAPPA